MTEKLVISNINQFMSFAAKTPGLLNIGGFSFLRPKLTTSCNRCGQKGAQLAELRPQWEAAFSVLSDREQISIKNILDTKKLCYYVRSPNGQLQLNCF